MKKLALCILVIFSSFSVFCQKLNFTNTFGGDSDNLLSEDILKFSKNEEGDFFVSNKTILGNRSQFDFKSSLIDSRLRLDLALPAFDDPGLNVRLKSFIEFSPVSLFFVSAGNSFFSKYRITSAYLAASDDYAGSGKVLKSGFGTGVKLKLGKEDDIKLLLLSGFDIPELFTKDVISFNDSEISLGSDFIFKDLFTLGVSFQNIGKGNFKSGAYAGTSFIPGFMFNAGFLYNLNDESVLPVYKDGSMYKVGKTKYAVQASMSWTGEKVPLFAAVDCISGLTDEYIHYADKRKVYETERRNNGGIPFYACFRMNYKPVKKMDLELMIQNRSLLYVDSEQTFEVLLRSEYKISEKLGTLGAGVRLDFDSTGFSDFSFPLTWKIKYSIK